MAKAVAAYYEVSGFGRRDLFLADPRRIAQAGRFLANTAVTGIAALGAVGLAGVGVTFVAAFVLNMAIATNPQLRAPAQTGPAALAIAQNTADLSAPAATFDAKWARVAASLPAGAVPLLAQPKIEIAANIPLPPARPAHVQPQHEVAEVTAPVQVAKLTPAPEAPVPLPQARPKPPVAAQPPAAELAPRVALATPPSPRPAPKAPPPQREAHNKAPVLPTADARTAIYDIAAHTVYLPNGERLEAHSGLGDKMDNPHYVNVRMRGPTPPNVYDLKLREELFHGVRAIRLTPVDEDKMFGRDGILAHTYMLGPNGQSNGCVSFRDYDKFLHAFLRGEVDRMVVVAGMGPHAPRFAETKPDTFDRFAANY
jgi:hypothetical protein